MSAVNKRGFNYKFYAQLVPSRHNQYRPLLFRNPWLFISSGVFAALLVISSIVAVEFSSPTVTSVGDMEQRIVAHINRVRAEEDASLQPLLVNTRLAAAASAKQEHMLEHNYWQHQAPSGLEAWEFIRLQNVAYSTASETLARGFDNAEDVVEAWMNSPSHREALLTEDYRQVGVAVREGEHGYEAVALFIQPVTSIADAGGVLSDIAPVSNQAILAVQPPRLSRIAEFVPGYMVMLLSLMMAISIVVVLIIALRQRKAVPLRHNHRMIYELPELHLILNVGIFLLLIGSVV